MTRNRRSRKLTIKGATSISKLCEQLNTTEPAIESVVTCDAVLCINGSRYVPDMFVPSLKTKLSREEMTDEQREQQRREEIERLFGADSHRLPNLFEKAIREAWTVERATMVLLQHFRDRRVEGVV